MNYTFPLKYALTILLCSCFIYLAAQKIATPFPLTPVSVKNIKSDGCATDILLAKMRANPSYKKGEEKMNRENGLRYRNGKTPQDKKSYVPPGVCHIINDDPSLITNQ